jgi:hypothetical protein
LEAKNLPAEVQPLCTELKRFQGRESNELISQVTLLKSSPKGKGFLIISSSVSKLIHLLSNFIIKKTLAECNHMTECKLCMPVNAAFGCTICMQ